MRINKAGKGVVVGGLAALLFAGSVASASWLAGGFFHFDVESAPLSPLEVSNVAVSGDLLPGESAALTFKLKNPNRVPVRGVAKARTDGANVTSDKSGCATYLSVTDGSTSSHAYYDATMAAGERVSVSVPGAVTLAADVPMSCYGAKYTVRVQTGATAGN